MMIVLVSVVNIRLLLLMLDRAALMMRRHVLSGVARGRTVSELHAPVVVGLETRFLIESIFETHAIVSHVSLFITGGKSACYTL